MENRIVKFIRYKVEGDNLRYYYIDENREVKSDSIPLMINGKKNERVELIVADVKDTMDKVNLAKAQKAASEAVKTINEDNNTIKEDNYSQNSSIIPEPRVIEIPNDSNNDAIISDENISDADLKGYNSDELADEENIQEAEYEEVEEDKKNKWKNRAKKGVLVATIALAAAFAIKAHLFKDKPATQENAIETEADDLNVGDLISDLKENTRYTDISEEDLVNTTQSLMDEFANHGIELTSDDALTFVTIANLTHIKETNPELLTTIFDGTDSVTSLTKTGHIIGQIVTNEVVVKNDTVDWTIALLDETDKKIADHNMNLINEAKKVIDNEKYPSEEKIGRVQQLFETKYVAPNFDKTIGYDFVDGTHTSLSQEDGADFITDAIFTGIALGDNDLKQAVNAKNSYVSVTKYDENKDYSNVVDHVELGNNNNTWMVTVNANELSNDLKAISENKDVVSNMMRIIEGCQDTNTMEYGIKK